ncbi:MAG TPA: invasion associated locus B family protein, partial [Stellaceae bacterium]|nr:invasion associated locus B family protein [Stellaceae bacterium]
DQAEWSLVKKEKSVLPIVSLDLGLDLPLNGAADVTIGKTDFSFFTKDHSAWSRDADADKAAVTAMVQGNTLVIKAKSAKGKALTDSYSLSGFSDALAAIDKACKYKR